MILKGIQAAGKKSINWNKIKEINQESTENASAFLDQIYATTDPESLEGNAILRSYFISQSAPNIRCKLQKLEIEPDSPTSCLVEVSYQVFNNRDIEEEKSEDKKAQRQTHLLAVALHCQLVSAGNLD